MNQCDMNQDDINLEAELGPLLRAALGRENPSRDFSRDYAARRSRVNWRSVLAVAAALAILALLPFRIYEQRQARGREAKQRLVLALEVAGKGLHRAQKLLRNSSL